jgi:predicted  nucleic acid-binding Zn-ribbon protein
MKRAAAEIAALVRLAELDAALLARQDDRRRKPVYDEVADERHTLGARLSPDILEAYERAMRGGRHPAVVSLVASRCSGCHVRLHSTLEQKIRRRRGVAPCPHCLRLVYDPAWLDAAVPRG